MIAERNVLVCAGLDPSGGAGILADTRVATYHGVRPLGIVTALTVQDTAGVREVQAVDAELVREQAECVLQDIEVQAVKIGMIGSTAIARGLAAALGLTGAPVVWDPITHPSRGDAWTVEREVIALLAPHLRLVTPNARELAWLVEASLPDLATAVTRARVLSEQLACAILVKGGHFDGDAIDILVEGRTATELSGSRIAGGEAVHGTGCALSTTIAARLALGDSLVAACTVAKQFVRERIEHPVRPGRGAAAVI